MLFSVALLPLADGTLRAVAPGLPGCDVVAGTAATALPSLRLKIEGHLTDLLAAYRPLPEPLSAADLHKGPGFPGARWMSIHINVGHLAALAVHQQGR